ncbi:hypothetical protein H1C71_030179, partial [Ictidomys tridecemlineatus]
GLLRSKGLKVKWSTLQRFLEEIDSVAPWFAFLGSLTIPSWDKLGKDLDFTYKQGTLKGGTIPLWKLVRGCIMDGKCQKAVSEGQAVLEQLHEEKPEGSHSEVA